MLARMRVSFGVENTSVGWNNEINVDYVNLKIKVAYVNSTNFLGFRRGYPSASKIEAKIFTEFELNLDHPGGK